MDCAVKGIVMFEENILDSSLEDLFGSLDIADALCSRGWFVDKRLDLVRMWLDVMYQRRRKLAG